MSSDQELFTVRIKPRLGTFKDLNVRARNIERAELVGRVLAEQEQGKFIRVGLFVAADESILGNNDGGLSQEGPEPADLRWNHPTDSRGNIVGESKLKPGLSVAPVKGVVEGDPEGGEGQEPDDNDDMAPPAPKEKVKAGVKAAAKATVAKGKGKPGYKW